MKLHQKLHIPGQQSQVKQADQNTEFHNIHLFPILTILSIHFIIRKFPLKETPYTQEANCVQLTMRQIPPSFN